ncbi:MAG TPA: DUF4198 domain-containing protein [Thermoanaerobaculia bacterium]|nr:DUF4198 domain-containing protein [Thermoanaerobaculia bacterium]
MARTLVPALLLAAAAPLAAHDLWLVPSTFRPAVGEVVTVRLALGHPEAPEAVARAAGRIARFAFVTPVGEVAVPGLDGLDPAGAVRVAAVGPQAIAYVGRPARSELAAADFAAYLREEGLEAVLAERRRRGEEAWPGRERYSRSLKALLAAGGADGADVPLGLPLELLRERVGEGQVTLRLLLAGSPLEGCLVELRPLAGGVVRMGRSGADGRVSLTLGAGGGEWLATAVHMRRSAEPDAEWESLWASLTFAAGGAAGGGQALAPAAADVRHDESGREVYNSSHS